MRQLRKEGTLKVSAGPRRLDSVAPPGRDLVASLDWPAESTVHLVTAYSVPVDWTGGVGATMDWMGDLEDRYRDELVDELKTMAEPLVERGLAIVPPAMRRRPAPVIVQAARELDADLVVIGSRGPATPFDAPGIRGHRGVHGCAMLRPGGAVGVSTANARCHRWVRHRAGGPASPRDVASSRTFRATSCRCWSGIRACSSFSPASTRSVTIDFAACARDSRSSTAGLDAAISDLTATGVAATPHAAEGEQAGEIIAMAEQCRSDLIVTGDRGLRGLERLVLGSVARNLLTHATASVLVTRPDLQAAPSAGRAALEGATR